MLLGEVDKIYCYITQDFLSFLQLLSLIKKLSHNVTLGLCDLCCIGVSNTFIQRLKLASRHGV